MGGGLQTCVTWSSVGPCSVHLQTFPCYWPYPPAWSVWWDIGSCSAPPVNNSFFLLEEINQSFHRYSNTAAAKPVLSWFHWGASTQYDRFESLVDTICKGHRWIILLAPWVSLFGSSPSFFFSSTGTNKSLISSTLGTSSGTVLV